MLPNPNPSGAATSDMMALSFQESTMYAVQSIDENIRGLRKLFASFLKVNTENLKLDKKQETAEKINRARERATAAEEKRESKFGTTLKSAATGVKDKALEIGKGMSLGGVLSTLLGGALLAAIFAPDKFDKTVKAVRDGFTSLMNSEFFDGITKIAKDIFKSFDWDNLAVTAILGWRIGALYSGLKYIGEKLKDWLGFSDSGDDTGIGAEDKSFIDKHFSEIFAGAGVTALLFPGLVGGVLRILTGLGSFIVSPITQAAKDILTGTIPNDVVSSEDQNKIKKSKKDIAKRMLYGSSLSLVRGAGLMGLFLGLGSLVGNVFEDGKIDGQDLTLENLGLTALSITSAVATFAPALITKMLIGLGGFLLGPALPFILAGLAVGGIAKIVYDAFNTYTSQEDLVKRQGGKLVNKLTDIGMNAEDQAEFIKRVEESDGSRKQINAIMKSKRFENFDFKGKQIDDAAFFYKKEYDDLPKDLKSTNIKSLSFDELNDLKDGYDKKIKDIDVALDVEGLAKVDGDVRKQLENEKQELEQRNQIIQKEINERTDVGGTPSTKEINERTDVGGTPSTADVMLYADGGDEALGGSQGSDTLGTTLLFEGQGQTMAPTYKAGSLRMNGLEAEMVSMNNAMKSQAPIVIASPSSSSPTSVDQSQTIINNSNRQTTISGGISQYTQSPTRSAASRFSVAFT